MESCRPNLNIAVFKGGASAEREVSLKSGQAVSEALQSRGHTISEIDLQGSSFKLPDGIDLAFLALHGSYGEDGQLQRRLEAMEVPFTGCDSESSHSSFDKKIAKNFMILHGIKTPGFHVVQTPDPEEVEALRYPRVIKPVTEGSSIGLYFAEDEVSYVEAATLLLEHHDSALVEEQIEGVEVTVGILNDRALPLVEVRPREGSYDYHNKYTAGATEYFCPAPLSAPLTKRIQETALATFAALKGRDFSRIDMMIDSKEEVYVLEMNTLPGMTETSLFPKAAAAVGIDFASLCEQMATMAYQRRTVSQAASG